MFTMANIRVRFKSIPWGVIKVELRDMKAIA